MRKTRILVVEDEKEIGLLLKKYLENENYEVVYREDGEAGFTVFKELSFDLIITDIMMPIMDGIKLCQEVRKISNVPIIFLTAKDDEVDKIVGLMQGADDYITKPFSIREVIARIKSMLRRYLKLNTLDEEKDFLRVDDIEIDFTERRVFKDGQEINFRLKEFEVLSLLAKSPEKVFSKGQIFEQVWQDNYLGDDNTVMVHIRRLRKKIETDPNNPKYIKTVWGLGYRFTVKES